MLKSKDYFYLVLLLMVAMFFWWGPLMPGKVLFLRDLSDEVIPKRQFWINSHGFPLWSPYAFFGTPYAANPQSEVFYPFNFFFLVFGAERGLVFYLFSHHMIFLLTMYLAFRTLEFDPDSSLLGAAGLGFGGYSVSLSLLIVVISTTTWVPLLIIFLKKAVAGRWLHYGLLLVPVFALQLLGGEAEFAVMGWLIAALAVITSRSFKMELKSFFRLFGALAFGLFWGVLLSLPQIALTLQLIPISNRGPGMSLKEAMALYMPFSQFPSFFIPNYLLPLDFGKYWGLGFFSNYSFFISFYLGATLLLLMIISFFARPRWRVVTWLLAGFLGLTLMTGPSLPFYELFYQYAPGMKLFQGPVKFFFLLNFSFVMLAVYGYLYLRARSFWLPLIGVSCFLAGAVLALFLISSPVSTQSMGQHYGDVADYLFFRSAFHSGSLLLIMAGVIACSGKIPGQMKGIIFGLMVLADLFSAHRLINVPVAMDFFKPYKSVREFKEKTKGEIFPPRIHCFYPTSQEMSLRRLADPVAIYGTMRDELGFHWAFYYGLNNFREYTNFHQVEVLKLWEFLKSARFNTAKLILARSGVEYFYSRDTGFVRNTGAFPRAMIFYQAQAIQSQDEIIKIWTEADFPAWAILLLESGENVHLKGAGLPGSHPAKITEYKNEKVVVEAEAKREGWLLLLDAYYPGWKAEVDGRPVEIFRADGFFRAVKIPAGKHVVSFSYFPDIFKRSLYVSGAGFLVWLVLMAYSLAVSARRRA